MISACTVILNRLQEFTKIFCQSIVESTTEVSEVILINPEMDSSINRTWVDGNIEFRLIGGKHNHFVIKEVVSFCAQHAYGLHQAVNLAKNDYILITDPDIFFYTKIDEFYMNLTQKYNLNYIGISRPDALSQCIEFFPCIMNLLTKKEYLPTKGFLPDFKLKLEFTDGDKLEDKYFYPDTIEQYKPLFPNPEGHCETGCNLLIWAKKNNYNWLSFQTPDCNTYYTKYYKSNFKPTNMPNKKILYHGWLSSREDNRIAPFKKAWETHKSVDLD